MAVIKNKSTEESREFWEHVEGIVELLKGEAAVAPQAQPPKDERKYPCADCGTMRSKSEGGTTFTVCDACFDKRRAVQGESATPRYRIREIGQCRFSVMDKDTDVQHCCLLERGHDGDHVLNVTNEAPRPASTETAQPERDADDIANELISKFGSDCERPAWWINTAIKNAVLAALAEGKGR
jgi:hypothetical protein